MSSYRRKSLLIVLIGAFMAGCLARVSLRALSYPRTRTDSVVDDYHGTKVADPYRWLENAESRETRRWVLEQNRLTFRLLRAIPARDKIKTRLTELLNYPRYSVPHKESSRYFFTKNDGLQNQSVLYMQTRLDGEPKIILDPNSLSKDGTVALTNQVPSKDGTLLAYGLSSRGSDRQEIRIRRVDGGQDHDEVIKWCKFAGIAWKADNQGFFYDRFPEPGTVPKEDESNYSRVYWHRLGTSQSDDRLIYERPDDKELGLHPIVTEDGKYLVLYVYRGTEPKNRIYYREAESDSPFVRLLDKADARYDFIGNVGPVFYFQTDLDAPRGRVIAIDTRRPDRESWREILPQQNDVISFVTMVNHQLVVAWMHDVYHQLKIYNLDGTFVREIELPALGSISGLSGKPQDTEMFFAYTSFLFPTNIYRYDFQAERLSLFRRAEIAFDPSPYETRQVFYHSKDGARIPMFITHKKGLKLNGDNPTLLYGYGGFNAEITPHFSVPVVVWLEHGGVYAVANIRGGGEYGEAWHQAAVRERRQSAFDDFLAAAQWLVENKYTRPSRLAIQGQSNGGLLVAACMVQRPDFFGAVLCQVPVTDMLRYHKFTVGRYWVPEFGNAEASADQFKTLHAYSPLHNVRAGVNYPPILVTTADTDDRVVPSHGRKFVAALQRAGGKNPVLLRTDIRAGHGFGKPMSKIIEEQSDIYGFLFETLGVADSVRSLQSRQ